MVGEVRSIARHEEATYAAHAAECYARLKEAVRMAQRGSYRAGNQLIRGIRERRGDAIADQALKEMKACVAEWKT